MPQGAFNLIFFLFFVGSGKRKRWLRYRLFNLHLSKSVMKKSTCGLKYLNHSSWSIKSLKLFLINMAACKDTLLEAVFYFTKIYGADLCTKNLNWVLRQADR